jgi:hypothetical protein
MSTVLSPEVKQVIDRANFAHLATLMPDGSPQSVRVWIGREGEQLVICSGENSLKGKNTRRAPRSASRIVDRRLHQSLRRGPDPRPGRGAPLPSRPKKQWTRSPTNTRGSLFRCVVRKGESL